MKARQRKEMDGCQKNKNSNMCSKNNSKGSASIRQDKRVCYIDFDMTCYVGLDSSNDGSNKMTCMLKLKRVKHNLRLLNCIVSCQPTF